MATFAPLYCDTDSIKQYIAHDKKALLNAWYGIGGNINMDRNYIVVNVDDKPTIIFKNNIIAITKNGNHTEITCVGDVMFYAKNDYKSVAEQLIK